MQNIVHCREPNLREKIKGGSLYYDPGYDRRPGLGKEKTENGHENRPFFCTCLKYFTRALKTESKTSTPKMPATTGHFARKGRKRPGVSCRQWFQIGVPFGNDHAGLAEGLLELLGTPCPGGAQIIAARINNRPHLVHTGLQGVGPHGIVRRRPFLDRDLHRQVRVDPFDLLQENPVENDLPGIIHQVKEGAGAANPSEILIIAVA